MLVDKKQADSHTFHVGNAEVEAELAATCLTYLCFDHFKHAVATGAKLNDLLPRYKSLKYAATGWVIHAHRANDNDDFFRLIMRLYHLQDEGRANYNLWQQLLARAYKRRLSTPAPWTSRLFSKELIRAGYSSTRSSIAQP